MASPVKAISQLDAPVAIVFVCCAQGLEDAELDATSIAVLQAISSARDLSSIEWIAVPWALLE